MSNNPKAVIFGIKGTQLSPAEENFIRECNPLGFILFSRNIEDKEQVKQLVDKLKAVTGRNTPILIDQEGGKVARLKKPNWRHPPEAAIFGQIAKHDQAAAAKACRINAELLAYDLYQLGINTNCAPVLDIFLPDAHSVIGNRAFSDDKDLICMLASKMIKGFSNCGVCSIIKHIPGHGRSKADSHLELPIVDTDLQTLRKTDFYPFTKLNNKAKWAMTAHILYSALDEHQPATFSYKVINEIRQKIGFKGIIITDCITMKALKGTMAEKAKKSLDAGCDVVLHSNGNLEEMTSIIEACPALTDIQMNIIKASYTELKPPSEKFNFKKLDQKLNQFFNKFNITSNYIPQFDPTERLH
jgi:beta-N-acetylhexosaminidase